MDKPKRVSQGQRLLAVCDCAAVRMVLVRESRITEGTVRGLCECGAVARVLDSDTLDPVPRPERPPHRPEVVEGGSSWDGLAIAFIVAIAMVFGYLLGAIHG